MASLRMAMKLSLEASSSGGVPTTSISASKEDAFDALDKLKQKRKRRNSADMDSDSHGGGGKANTTVTSTSSAKKQATKEKEFSGKKEDRRRRLRESDSESDESSSDDASTVGNNSSNNNNSSSRSRGGGVQNTPQSDKKDQLASSTSSSQHPSSQKGGRRPASTVQTPASSNKTIGGAVAGGSGSASSKRGGRGGNNGSAAMLSEDEESSGSSEGSSDDAAETHRAGKKNDNKDNKSTRRNSIDDSKATTENESKTKSLTVSTKDVKSEAMSAVKSSSSSSAAILSASKAALSSKSPRSNPPTPTSSKTSVSEINASASATATAAATTAATTTAAVDSDASDSSGDSAEEEKGGNTMKMSKVKAEKVTKGKKEEGEDNDKDSNDNNAMQIVNPDKMKTEDGGDVEGGEGGGDDDDEEEQKAKDSSAKKKSGGRMIRSVDESLIIEGPDSNTRTPRAAATIAKTKLAQKGPSRSSSLDGLRDSGGGTSPKLNNITAVGQPTKLQKQLQSILQQKAAATQPAATTLLPVVEVEDPWVQCESCNKWRKLPKHVSPDNLPEQWYCRMNEWDSNRNTCEADEEVVADESAVPMDVQIDPPSSIDAVLPTPGSNNKKNASGVDNHNNNHNNNSKNKQLSVDPLRGGGHQNNKSRASSSASSNSPRPGGRTSMDKDVNSDEEKSPTNNNNNNNNNNNSNNNNKKQHRDDHVEKKVVAVEKVEWVECSSCQKWRKVAPYININSLPDQWFCHMNNWNTHLAKCSAKQEEDTEPVVVADLHATSKDTHNARGSSGESHKQSNHRGGSGGGGSSSDRRRESEKEKEKERGAARDSFPPPKPGFPLPVVVKNDWVQCDRKSCGKWRKVPGHIDASKFPAQWYCEYNTWDPDRAGCDVAEDSDSEDESKKGGGKPWALITANSKGQNVLSYRKIIYGTDGKIRPMYAEKNNSGYGLFSVGSTAKINEDNGDIEETFKKVNYWWSSNLDEAGVNFTISGKAGKKGNSRADKKDEEEQSALQVVKESSAKGHRNSLIEHIFRPNSAAFEYDHEEAIVSTSSTAMPAFHPTLSSSDASSLPSTYFTDSTSLKYMWPKKVAKCQQWVESRTFLEKQRDLCSLVRNTFYYLDQSCLAFDEIFMYIMTNKMETWEAERAKLDLDYSGLRDTIRILEENSEIVVKTDVNGVFFAEFIGYQKHYLVNTVIKDRRDTVTSSSVDGSAAAAVVHGKGKKDKADKEKCDKTSKTPTSSSSSSSSSSFNSKLSVNTDVVPQMVAANSLLMDTGSCNESRSSSNSSSSSNSNVPLRLKFKNQQQQLK